MPITLDGTAGITNTPSVTSTGAVSGTTGTFSGDVSAANVSGANASFSKITSTGNAILGGDVYQKQGAPTSLSAGTTLTAAQIATGIIINTAGSGQTFTLPTGTALDAQFTDLGIDQAFDFYVISSGAINSTIAVNTGITSVGAMQTSNNTSGHYRLRKTATATYILYRIS